MFSDIIRKCYGSNLLRNIVNHPFHIELVSNTLNIESFKFFVQQGILFFEDYIRAVLIVASKIKGHSDIVPLTQVAQGVIIFHKMIRGHYCAIYGINHKKKSPECFNFTNFFSSILYSDTYEAVTILYSCMFMWKSIVDSMTSKFKKNNRYRDWFNFCSSSLIDPRCVILENIVDKYCKKVGGSEKSRMLELFKISAQFELDFLDSTYKIQSDSQVALTILS